MAAESNIGQQFLTFLAQLRDQNARIHILTDSEAGGLPAEIIVLMALQQAGMRTLRPTCA